MWTAGKWQISSLIILCCTLALMQCPLVCSQKDSEWPWSQVYVKYTGSMGLRSIKENLNLATVVMHGAEVYSKHEWDWGRERLLPLLRGIAREEIQIRCRMVNGSTHEKVTRNSVQAQEQ